MILIKYKRLSFKYERTSKNIKDKKTGHSFLGWS